MLVVLLLLVMVVVMKELLARWGRSGLGPRGRGVENAT